MKGEAIKLTYKVELLPGEKLTLPASLIESVGEGCMTTIQSGDFWVADILFTDGSALLLSRL